MVVFDDCDDDNDTSSTAKSSQHDLADSSSESPVSSDDLGEILRTIIPGQVRGGKRSASPSSSKSSPAKRKRRKMNYPRTCTTCGKKDGRQRAGCRGKDCGGLVQVRRKCKECKTAQAAPGKDICAREECGGTPTMPLCRKCGIKSGNRATTPGAGKVGRPGEKGCCTKCGGGPRCTELGCNKGAQGSKRGTGKVGKCIRHGGGDRCEQECCKLQNPPLVVTYYHPDTEEGICTNLARNMVNHQRYVLFDEEKAVELDKFFKFKKTLLLRAEHAFYFELVKRVPELALFPAEDRALDRTIRSAIYGKTKNLKDYRPDYFHLFRRTMMALHGEFDENDKHEESEDRLRAIADHAQCGSARTYYFRVRAHLDNKKLALFDLKTNKANEYSYYQINSSGRSVVDRVAAYVKECLARMKAGHMPPLEVGGKLPIVWF